MKVIVGLGNPGAEYARTRHNTGFMALDAFAAEHGLQWQQKDRFKAQLTEGVVDGQKIILVKPSTFYNLAGEAAQAIMQFYKIQPVNVLVVHDELDLPFGVIRARIGGSDAGNNGIKSIAAHVAGEFARVRVGIANEFLARTDAAEFVLSTFTADENQKLPALLQQSGQLITSFIAGDFAHTTVGG